MDFASVCLKSVQPLPDVNTHQSLQSFFLCPLSSLYNRDVKSTPPTVSSQHDSTETLQQVRPQLAASDRLMSESEARSIHESQKFKKIHRETLTESDWMETHLC